MVGENSQIRNRFGRGLRWVLKAHKKSMGVSAVLGVLIGAVIGILTDNLVLWLIVGFLVFGSSGVIAGPRKGS